MTFKDTNYYHNIFLEKVSYELPKKLNFCIKHKCYIIIEWNIMECYIMMLLRQANQKSAIFVTTGIFK